MSALRQAMQLKRLFRRRPPPGPVESLYAAVVRQARLPGFYRHAGVPDTLDGRFDMILLHAFLLLHRLKGLEGGATELAQGLCDAMFDDMDRNLREIGVGDLSVGKHVKRMVAAFHGRVAAYETGLAAGEAELEAALRRNLYGTAAPRRAEVVAIAAYMRREVEGLAAQPPEALLEGRVRFGPAPGS